MSERLAPPAGFAVAIAAERRAHRRSSRIDAAVFAHEPGAPFRIGSRHRRHGPDDDADVAAIGNAEHADPVPPAEIAVTLDCLPAFAIRGHAP